MFKRGLQTRGGKLGTTLAKSCNSFSSQLAVVMSMLNRLRESDFYTCFYCTSPFGRLNAIAFEISLSNYFQGISEKFEMKNRREWAREKASTGERGEFLEAAAWRKSGSVFHTATLTEIASMCELEKATATELVLHEISSVLKNGALSVVRVGERGERYHITFT